MRLSDLSRETLVKVLIALYEEAVAMGLPEAFLNSMEAQIKLCSKPYSAENARMKFAIGNDRRPKSLAGETAAYIYAMHLWKVLPPWMNIEMAHDYKQQVVDKVDITIDGVSEQIKSGNEGTSHDIYRHNEWFAGIAENVTAVCWQTKSIHKHTRKKWKMLSEQCNDPKWIGRDVFLQNGGTIEPIHPDIVAIVERVLCQ